jgi:hypothetical protein
MLPRISAIIERLISIGREALSIVAECLSAVPLTIYLRQGAAGHGRHDGNSTE